MSIHRASLLVTALSALLLAGCAGSDAGDADGAGSAPTTVPTTVPSPTPTELEPALPLPGTKPTKPAFPGQPTTGTGVGTRTVTGTVGAGVEPGCLVLAGPDDSYLLIFSGGIGPSAAPVGSTVTVVGQVQPQLVTTCQQGTPLVVSAVRPG